MLGMDIDIMKEYGSHDNIKSQNCSFLTIIVKVWIIVFFEAETWNQHKDWRDSGVDQTKGRIGMGMGRERIEMK